MELGFSAYEKMMHQFNQKTHKKTTPIEYAKNYLKKIIKNEIENLNEILASLKINECKLFDYWFSYIEKKGYRISLSEDEMDTIITKKSKYIIHSFSEFIEELQI
ncbi:hypothetical protein PSI23_10225 [Xenorhabdus sp. XENO-10]|uniref:Phage protein n=1 Tax=Xenorhabdus yunnanensis TaxID=3025878 RepID=A0ABT5LEX0_9GAMM|nr:hypothetical protein [Xenorhabdus yunnanensis]MDC9589662.1 hypothetical protein [Xenorhabdus yunnanensis]